MGALISDTARLPETLMAILAFSLTDIFDTIGTLIGTGEKVGIVATNGENHQSDKLDKASLFRLDWYFNWCHRRYFKRNDLC